MSGEAGFEVPTGSVAAGRRVRLPSGAGPPIRVFVNGVEQREGEDYLMGEGEILFTRPIVKEGKLGAMRWLSMLIGLVGSYRKHETVDVEYHVSGAPRLAADVEILP